MFREFFGRQSSSLVCIHQPVNCSPRAEGGVKTIGFLILFFLHAATASAAGIGAEGVIARSIAARGGHRNFKRAKTERMTGKIAFGAGPGNLLTVEMKAPNKIRTELTLEGKTITRTFDGRDGWQLNPLNGQTAPVKMTAEEAANIAKEGDFNGPMADYKAKGYQIELMGEEPLEAGKAYKVRLTWKDRTTDLYYIDEQSWLPVKWQGTRVINGKTMVFESLYRDYRKVSGLMFPFAIETSTQGSDRKQQITFGRIEVNPPIDDSRFTLAPANAHQ